VTSGQPLNDHPYYVGFGNEHYGTVMLGHQYDSMHDYFAPFTLTGSAGGTAFAHPFDNDNANNSYLARNAIKYSSAQIAGFSFGGMYALSNTAGRFANNRAYSVGANYQNGAFSAGAAYLHLDGRGNLTAGAYDAAALPGSNRDAFNATVGVQNTYGVGANYALANLTLGAAWSRSTYTSVADAETGASSARSMGFSNYEINGVYQLMPALTLTGAYTYTKASDAHWHQGAVQLDYMLSKRTDTYVEAVYQRASGSAPAMINTADPASGASQLLVAAGIRHHF
jgi:predicted porin